jgi:hypothetical protein
MAEQVVSRGELHAQIASLVGYCSWLVAAVLEVYAAGQRRDVAAATAVPAATAAQPGMAAEMGARVWRREFLG